MWTAAGRLPALHVGLLNEVWLDAFVRAHTTTGAPFVHEWMLSDEQLAGLGGGRLVLTQGEVQVARQPVLVTTVAVDDGPLGGRRGRWAGRSR